MWVNGWHARLHSWNAARTYWIHVWTLTDIKSGGQLKMYTSSLIKCNFMVQNTNSYKSNIYIYIYIYIYIWKSMENKQKIHRKVHGFYWKVALKIESERLSNCCNFLRIIYKILFGISIFEYLPKVYDAKKPIFLHWISRIDYFIG